MSTDQRMAAIRALYQSRHDDFERFMNEVCAAIQKDQREDFRETVHSCRGRVKDIEHLISKIPRAEEKLRKKAEEEGVEGAVLSITSNNLLQTIQDIVGVRILTLYRDGIEPVHAFIHRTELWDVLVKETEAYVVLDEDRQLAKKLGLQIKTQSLNKPYTSFHYIVQSKQDEDIRCEIQVRGLHLEGWGEVDHQLRYPDKDPGPIAEKVLSDLFLSCSVTDSLANFARMASREFRDQNAKSTNLSKTFSDLLEFVNAKVSSDSLTPEERTFLDDAKRIAEQKGKISQTILSRLWDLRLRLELVERAQTYATVVSNSRPATQQDILQSLARIASFARQSGVTSAASQTSALSEVFSPSRQYPSPSSTKLRGRVRIAKPSTSKNSVKRMEKFGHTATISLKNPKGWE